MAWSTRPCSRGDLLLCADVLPCGISGLRTKQIINLQCGASDGVVRNAVCRRSLPCVDVVDVGFKRTWLWPEQVHYCLLKPHLQKRLKRLTGCGGKHLGCREGRKRIAVRTKWQSGRADGNAATRCWKGNHLHRQREVHCWESLPVPKP